MVNNLAKTLPFAICFGILCTIVSFALMQFGESSVTELAGTLNIIPFYLTMFAAMVIRWQIGIGLLVFAAFVFLQWFTLGFAVLHAFQVILSMGHKDDKSPILPKA